MSTLLTFVLMLFTVTVFAQTRTVSGNVTDESGDPAIAATVKVTGTEIGTVTDIDGNFTLDVPEDATTVTISYIGMEPQTVAISDNMTVQLVQGDTVLEDVVVTALGIEREKAQLSYASQEVEAEQLNVAQSDDVKTALAGKIAGVQINGQAGSKLGGNGNGKIRIRQAISLTNDDDPLYVVDGVPIYDASMIDMNMVSSVNVLKGPVATALYGQRAESGVVVITSKDAAPGLAVEVNSSVTSDNVSYLPNMQNTYGGGYLGQDSWGIFGQQLPMSAYPDMWQQFEGMRYIKWDSNYADESWGPKFDGEEYIPWYAYWPDSPYYGQTATYEAQPDNIKNFYDTGLTYRNSVALNGGSDKFNARLSYTNHDQQGILPSTDMQKNMLGAKINYNALENLTVDLNVQYTNRKTHGYFTDGYGNQVSGSFNSWFSRGISTAKLKELKDLETPDGYSTSWNWWGPDYYADNGGGFKKPAFWFNPYTFMDRYDQDRITDNLLANLSAEYQITDALSLNVGGSRDQNNYEFAYYFPNSLASSAAPGLYNAWINSFGVFYRDRFENNYHANLVYDRYFGDWELNLLGGGNIRKLNQENFSNQMNPGANAGGLIIPDLYDFANTTDPPTPLREQFKKKVNSLYSKLFLGYKDFLMFDASYRQDWSSALPEDNNGYGYPGFGTSFIFTELMSDSNILSFGKVRAGWAQVGSDVSAHLIYPVYAVGNKIYSGSDGVNRLLQYAPRDLVDPNLTPALNTAWEGGFDLEFIDRVGLNFTYYNETREDDIVPISIPASTGFGRFLTNAGEVQRQGVEITLDGDVFEDADGFSWYSMFNFAKGEVMVNALPAGLNEIAAPGGTAAFGVVTMTHELGNEWGQLKGTAIKRDEAGNPVLQSNGLYAVEPNQYLGSVLPDFTGGFFNSFSYKNFDLTASFDFQKGGKFFTLSEYWGQYSGLLEETAAINDRGVNVREPVADGGGVHVTGVDESGNAVDMYVPAYDFFHQGRSNNIAELFIHEASFIKLRSVKLGYTLPESLFGGEVIKGGHIDLVGRNLALFGTSDDNPHQWDPSEMAETYGENGQLPGTRSFGVNLNLKF